jgi:hypothetical protein
MTAFLGFIGSPIGRWLIIAALIAASYGAAYMKGRNDGFQKREAIAQEELAQQDRLSAALAALRGRVTERVVTVYRDRIKVVREKGEEVIRYVEKLVPADSCPLPGGWRVLHDAAAEGRIPAAPERIDAAAVSAQEAARTVASNYSTCRETAERLTSLQAWVTQQHDLSKGD